MDKRILEEYIDACEVIKEAEAEIRKLESKKSITANETVSGSNPEFPYNPQHFKVQGTTYSYSDDVRIRQKKEILRQKKEKAEQLKLQVEVWLISIPFRMQRIIKYKIFEEMTWQQVADRMGRRGTAESIREEFQRFLKKLKFVPNVPHVPMKDAIVYHERIGNIQDVQFSFLICIFPKDIDEPQS
ncbi:MAG: RNA polymerase subunit sigma-70 [Blautia faecis]